MSVSMAILTAGVVASVVLALGAWAVVYQLTKQHGRLLLRLDGLEGMLGGAVDVAGLPVGTPLEPFELPLLNGGTLSLQGLRGKRALLVNWNPDCGFCERVAPEFAVVQPDLAKRNTELVLLAHGDEEANRELAAAHGFSCPILLAQGDLPLAAFAGLGTPAAYLLDEQGRITQPLALGADEVLKLTRAAASNGRRRLSSERSLRESRIERGGLRAGTPAPGFRLPDLRGELVSLDRYRGRRLLLVFSDPDCGPCEALAPELVRIDGMHGDGDLALILVSRGEPEATRGKATEYNFDFPVLVQKGWHLSKQYGIFETPVAFLIDEEGVIVENVARGVDEIVALADRAVVAGSVGARGW